VAHRVVDKTMKLESSYINLLGLRFHAYHGVLEQEQIVGNDYCLDVRMKYNISKAMLSDNIDDTLNYAKAYELIREDGPDHAKEFYVEAKVGDLVIGKGSGNSKKAAEQEAAYQGIMYFKKIDNK
jgi:hypothetical protein